MHVELEEPLSILFFCYPLGKFIYFLAVSITN